MVKLIFFLSPFPAFLFFFKSPHSSQISLELDEPRLSINWLSIGIESESCGQPCE